MKIILTIIFWVIFLNLYAQKLTCEKVEKYNFNEIYSELILENKCRVIFPLN